MTGRTRRDTSLRLQTIALLKKNILLLWRKKWQTALDWMNCVAMVLMLFALTYIYRNSSKDSITSAQDLGRLDQCNKRDFIVGYVTSTPDVQEIMQKVNESIKNLGLTVQEFLDEEHMLKNTSRSAEVGVVFDSKFRYSIRYKAKDVPNPSDLQDIGTCRDDHVPCFPSLYWENGFLILQATIDAAIVELTTNHSVHANMASIVAVQMKSTRTRKYMAMGSLIFAMCIIYTTLLYTMMVTISKERMGLRETMRMMGLRDSAYWLSWGSLYALYMVVIAPMIALVVSIFLFVESSYGVLLLLFLLYGISMSIHMENDFQGVFFSDIAGDSCHILLSYIGLLLDSVLYILLTLYFDKILTDKHGLKLEPLFFLCPSYWSKGKMTTIPLDTMERDGTGAEDHIEKVPVEMSGKEAIRYQPQLEETVVHPSVKLAKTNRKTNQPLCHPVMKNSV